MAAIEGYRALAKALCAEGVDTHFTLIGNGNMHLATAFAQEFGGRNIHARHEHCACSMAMGYAWATGRVGFASTTHGPGFTQITTALAVASRSRIPLVVFVSDTPTTNPWHPQKIDQAAIARAAGAEPILIRHVDRLLSGLAEAFYFAQYFRRPVILIVPIDIQKQLVENSSYVCSAELIPKLGAIPPDSLGLDRAIELVAASSKPIIVAGRGGINPDTRSTMEQLAENCGALLATTLHARGLFDGNEYSIGIAGAFSTAIARELFSECDLVLAFGASLGHFTKAAGKLFPNAKVVQVCLEPHGLWQGRRAADCYIQADATESARALNARLAGDDRRTRFRTAATRDRIQTAAGDTEVFPIAEGTVDPRRAMEEIDAVIPKDWIVVGGSGHSFYFCVGHMADRPPDRFLSVKEFGAIGSNLSYAIGIAAARDDGKVVLFDGDGGLLMHVQELETIARHNLRLLIVVQNDGAYGTEVHRLRAEGLPPDECVFGRTDFAGVARKLGLRGETITDLGRFGEMLSSHTRAGVTTVWDLHIADNVTALHQRLGK